MDLLDKLHSVAQRVASLSDGPMPFDTVVEEVLGPTEVVVEGRRTLMCGSNNYFGLTFHPEVRAAARDAIDRHGAGTTGSRAANGTFARHPRRPAPLSPPH